ncbi:MAG TPA: CoA-binding protein [Acidobacteriaceae bacterium]|nr:CoA-binding protein [Acidobacteriaceae bacterium]
MPGFPASLTPWRRIPISVNDPAAILEMLGGPNREPRTVAVVGLSDDPRKPSHSVSAYMQRAGYRIFPVNPAVTEVLGERSYASLRDLPFRPDVVNVFRLPKYIPGIVDEMIEAGLRNLWVQLGILHPAAAERAEQAGIQVVMDRCILIEHRRLLGR